MTTQPETHGPEAIACASCEEPSTELQLICAQGGRSSDEGDECPRFCLACVATTPLICSDHGEVCRRCGHDINLTAPSDGGEPVIDRRGHGTCSDCSETEAVEGLRAEVTTTLVARVVRLEQAGTPARRLVNALLDVLEEMTRPQGDGGPT